MFQVFRVDVEKVNLDISILWDVADVLLDISDVVFLNVADVVLYVAKSHVDPKHQGPMLMLGVVSRGRRAPDVGCCKL
jgi:hypothetical protein